MVSLWNAAYCVNRDIGMLLFESLDGDTYDRTLSPITIDGDEPGFTYSNTVNTMMDHVWDGFYTGQVRLSRFPVQIETGHDYEIKMTGTPPGKMRYTLKADGGAIKLKIKYGNPTVMKVTANGREVDETDWDRSLGQPGLLTKRKGCGEYRWVSVQNYLEFYLTAGCEVKLEPIDQIRSTVRLDWTFDEFYAEGGTTTFADRVGATLGIPAWRIKTVAVYEGSVIIEFVILPDLSNIDPIADLQNVGQALVDAFSNNKDNWLGAPILDVTSGDQVIINSGS